MPTAGENEKFIFDNIGSILDEAVEWVVINMRSEEVFTQNALEVWAEDNGFIKENDG